jgi:hypothetical protein
MPILARLVILLACALPGCYAGMPGSYRAVELHGQQTASWCWAATNEMLSEFVGSRIRQCDQANTLFPRGRSDCCSGGCPKSEACNMPGYPTTALKIFGFTFKESFTPLTWRQLTEQFDDRKKPFAYSYAPIGGRVGHMVVIYGYKTIDGKKFLYVNDPWPPCDKDGPGGSVIILPYEEYANPSDRVYWSTVYDIAKEGK